MAARGRRNEEEDEDLSSDGSDEVDSNTSGGGSDDSDGSASPDSESDSANEDEDEDEDEDAETHELKQAQVRSDIEGMRLMGDEMEKIKQRLLFRLAREKQAKLVEADWQRQQQQLADEERQRRELQRLADEKAEKKAHEASKTAQVAAEQQLQKFVPERSFVEIGVQTELDTAHAERKEHMSSNIVQQARRSMEDLSQRQTANTSQQASVPAEGQSARLSLYDLGKSYGLKEATASPPRQDLTYEARPNRSAQAPPTSAAQCVPVPPSEASDADTFFIRRDSNRTSWQPDVPDHNNDSFRRSRGSALVSEYGDNDHPGSPTSPTDARMNKSAFDTLRSSILSNIHEGEHNDNAASEIFESRRGHMGLASSSAVEGNDERVAKTDDEREQEAIQSLLFGR